MACKYGSRYAFWEYDEHGLNGPMGIRRTVFDAGDVGNYDGRNDVTKRDSDDINLHSCRTEKKQWDRCKNIIRDFHNRIPTHMDSF